MVTQMDIMKYLESQIDAISGANAVRLSELNIGHTEVLKVNLHTTTLEAFRTIDREVT